MAHDNLLNISTVVAEREFDGQSWRLVKFTTSSQRHLFLVNWSNDDQDSLIELTTTGIRIQGPQHIPARKAAWALKHARRYFASQGTRQDL